MLARSSGDFDAAVEASREAVRIRRLHADESPVELVDALEGLAKSLEFARRFDEMGSVLDECEAIIGGLPGDRRRARADLLMHRADYLASGPEDYPGAEALLHEAIDLLNAVDPGSSDLQIATNNLATYLLAEGKLDEAGEVYTKALAGSEERFGADHPEYASTLENLANIDYRQKRYDESMDKLERVREIRARNLGADHVDVLRTTLNMAAVANGSGQYERALAIQDELLPRLREIRGDHPETALVMRNRGDTLYKLGRLPEAEAAVRESLAVYLRVYGADHQQVARTRADLGAILADQERWAEAEAELAQALPIMRATFGDDHERTRKVLERSAEVADARGRAADASAYRALLAGGADPGP
jgi:tetratricopeptide (TPR) repeat protein